MTQTSRLVIELDSRDAEAKAADTRKALEALEDAGLSIQPALNKAGAGMEKMGKGAEKATKSIEDETDELERLLGQIDPVVRRLGELDKQEQDLAKHRKAGKLDTATYDEYKAKIDTARKGLTSFDDSLTRAGNTAKQTAAALRGVPAQFTDIAVSLQGGQNPLTVFLQQGGQLKDMFGGAGPAAKALGGYVLGLINPFTVAAAAVGTLGLAYYKGSQELDAYNKSIIFTGNVAGTSASQLAAMAQQVGATVGTTGAAAEVLAKLAGNTKIAGDSFGVITAAALQMEKTTGKAIAETVEEFSRIAKDPVEAAKALNDQYHFLTSSAYAQIVALKEQGDAIGATKLLTDTYASTIQERTGQVTQNLGLIESAWNRIKSAAAGALDATLSVGRVQTLEQQAEVIRLRLKSGQGTGGRAAGMGIETRNAAQDQKDLDFLELQIEAEKVRTKWIENARKENDLSVSSQAALNSQLATTNSNAKKLKERLAEINELAKNAAGGNGGKVYSEAQLEQLREAARKQYADPKVKALAATKAYTEDVGLKMLDAARQANAVLLQQNASINGQGIATQKLGTQAQALIKWEQQLADIKGKQTLTADQKSLLASQDLITAQLKKNVALEREAEISKGIQQAQKDQVQLLTLTGQLREANSLKSSLDDAAQMAEYERQGNTEAAKRLETLIKIRDINLNSAQKPGTVEGVSKAPTTTGLDASVGGAYSEIDRLNTQQAALDAWRATELEKQKAYLGLKAINEQIYAERVANIDKQAQAGREQIEKAKNSAIMTASSDFFGNMAVLSQSGNSRLAAIGKAAAIAQTTISTYKSATDSYAALAAIPVIGPALGFAAAGAAITAGLANVAAITGIGFSNGGYTGAGGVNDPAGTVHKGEIVWSQSDIRKFGGVASVEALRNGNVSAIRGGSGRSGVSGQAASTQAPTPSMSVEINNYSAARVSTQTDEAGKLRVIIQEVEAHLVKGVAHGNGDLNEVLAHSYGLGRKGY